METNLHFSLTKKIIELFNSELNTSGAQLIFSTHSPLLMDINILNRDQMWILNLKKCQSTKLNRLSETQFKVRKDTSITQKIIEGAYGSAPDLNKLS